MSAHKQHLRQDLRHMLSEMDESLRRQSDKALCEAFLEWDGLVAAQTILLYYGIGTEIKTATLLPLLQAQGKRLCLPRCLPDRQMEAREVLSGQRMVLGAFGIPEPSPEAPLVSKGDIDLILVPALCYDKAGYRLGQGGGYYDRYLAEYGGRTVGLCRAALLQTALPREEFDVPVHAVLTETGLSAAIS